MSELSPIRLAEARPMAGFRPIVRSGPGPAAPVLTQPAPQPIEDPFEQGYRKGLEDAEAAIEAERSQLLAVVASLEALQSEPSEELALLIAETVHGLVRLIAGEVAVDPELLVARARSAAAIVAEADGARTLHLHPQDIALLDVAALPLVVIPDPELERGSVRVEDSAGWVEDGVATHLDRLREQLGLKAQAE
ncbi:MAG TPA: FliH/SctL family protein [Sphingomicrobium sp.]|nr:FliH/SctL family protein [Sphingomicrobium sp.]